MSIKFLENNNFRFDSNELLKQYDINDWKLSPWIQLHNQKIYVSFQKTGFGERLLLICPICNQKYMTLYKGYNYYNYSNKKIYTCRKCLGLNYASQQTRKRKRYEIAIDKIYQKYNLESYTDFYISYKGIDNYNNLQWHEKSDMIRYTYSKYRPFKAKFMHESTYEKIIEKIENLQKKWLICFNKKYSSLLGRKVDI